MPFTLILIVQQLGIPTANIPITGASVGGREIESGVYYGWAGISFSSATGDASLAPLPKAPADVKEADARHHSPSGAHAITHDDVHGSTHIPSGEPSVAVYPMVMSIGWNPYYKNTVRTVEVHVIHKFHNDFYNALMNLSILGFIRPELNYDSLQALIDDINFDTEVAKKSLDREAYLELKKDEFLKDFNWGKEGTLDEK